MQKGDMNTNVTTCQPVYRLKSEANQYGSITMIASGWADAFSHWQWESEAFPSLKLCWYCNSPKNSLIFITASNFHHSWYNLIYSPLAQCLYIHITMLERRKREHNIYFPLLCKAALLWQGQALCSPHQT